MIMNDDFRSVAEIIASEPGLKKVRELIRDDEVLDKFFQIFPHLQKYVLPEKISKKILYLKIENAVLRGELKFHDEEIIAKINSFFNEERIKRVRFFS